MYVQAPRFECAVSTRPTITLPCTPDPNFFDGIPVNSPWNPQTVFSTQEYSTSLSYRQKFFPGYYLASGSSRSCSSEEDITAAQPLATSTDLPAAINAGYPDQSAARYPAHPQMAPRYQHVSADSTTPESSTLTSNSQHEYQVIPQLNTLHFTLTSPTIP